MQIPLSKFCGPVKQVSREACGPAASIVLDTAFPQFWPADPNSEDIRSQERFYREHGVDTIIRDMNPLRRFSGRTLPRHRYFSLCHDDTGNDLNTLGNELNFYLDPLRAGLVSFGDMAPSEMVEQFKSRFGLERPQGQYLLVLGVGRPGAISPVIDALGRARLVEEDVMLKQRKDRCVVEVQIPYTVETREINSVLDLRALDAQDFIVEEFFSKDTDKLKKKNRSGIDRFVDSLPLLMYPALGGGDPGEPVGGTLDALAAFIRSQGAEALIYPSARCDVLAENNLRQLRRWRGWCLVDFRNAPNPLTDVLEDASDGWPKVFPKDAAIRVATQGEYAGSFEVSGIVEWCRKRVNDLEAEFLRRSIADQ